MILMKKVLKIIFTLIVHFLYGLSFMFCLRNHLLLMVIKIILCVFGVFFLLLFTFRSTIHLELIFMYYVKIEVCSPLHSFPVFLSLYSVVSPILWKLLPYNSWERTQMREPVSSGFQVWLWHVAMDKLHTISGPGFSFARWT